jgi:hypothetical protein
MSPAAVATDRGGDGPRTLIPFAPATPQNSTDSLDDKSPATLEDMGPLIVRSATLARYLNGHGNFVLVVRAFKQP